MTEQTITAAQYVAQLQDIAAAQAAITEFKLGQLVRRKRFTLPLRLRDGNHLSIGIVAEIIPNLRAFTGDKSDTTGCGVRLSVLSPDGGYNEALGEGWQYEVLSPEQIAELLQQTAQ